MEEAVHVRTMAPARRLASSDPRSSRRNASRKRALALTGRGRRASSLRLPSSPSPHAHMLRRLAALAVAAAVLAPAATIAQQPNDSAYTARIRELTPTDSTWRFTTELVDHLPAASTVPSPLKVLGYVPGTIGRLARAE